MRNGVKTEEAAEECLECDETFSGFFHQLIYSSLSTMYVHRDYLASGVKIPYFKSLAYLSIHRYCTRSHLPYILYQRCPLCSVLCALCTN